MGSQRSGGRSVFFQLSLGDALSCRVTGQNFIVSRDIIFATSVVDLKLNSRYGHMYRKKRLCLQGDSSNAFPGKCFVQYNLILNFFFRRLRSIDRFHVT